MNRFQNYVVLLLTSLFLVVPVSVAQDPKTESGGPTDAEPDSVTEQTVNVGDVAVHYRAVAGTLTVGSTNEIDALLATNGRWLPTLT